MQSTAYYASLTRRSACPSCGVSASPGWLARYKGVCRRCFRKRCGTHARNRVVYLPTAEEIAAACAVVRAGWSEDETLRRGRWEG